VTLRAQPVSGDSSWRIWTPAEPFPDGRRNPPPGAVPDVVHGQYSRQPRGLVGAPPTVTKHEVLEASGTSTVDDLRLETGCTLAVTWSCWTK
jgi:hypothetical protein